jgi:hypothetical protein
MTYRIGAIVYLGWGLLHLLAAYQVYTLGASLPAGMIRGRLFQAAWNLAFFAAAVSVVAVVFNWHNSPLGYWLNLAAASVTDIGFVLFILAPGHLPLRRGILGPVLWLLATVFSTLGVLAITA